MFTSRLRAKFRVEEGEKKIVLSASEFFGIETPRGKKKKKEKVSNAQ